MTNSNDNTNAPHAARPKAITASGKTFRELLDEANAPDVDEFFERKI